MSKRPVAAILLAAGQGTRMKSDLHKVLHPIGGRPMIRHLLAAVDAFEPARKVVVVGSRREQLQAALPEVSIAVQEPQLGTGHAVQAAEAAMAGFAGDVLILYGDVPLVSEATMRRLIDALHSPVGERTPGIAVLGFRPEDAGAYGRIIAGADGVIAKMVEYKDASADERAVTLCNSGMMAVRGELLFGLLTRVTNNNAQGEYYLPDIVMLAGEDGIASVVVETSATEVAGVNSRVELAQVEAMFQADKRHAAMVAGVTLIAPQTVFFSFDTGLGRDVLVEPYVVFGPGVRVEDGVTIHAHSHLEGCTVRNNAEIGPYARLRPGADIGAKAKVGNFVEVKNTTMAAGAKANHLTYLGDATVGEKANVGAGTITCNYDGYFKHKTQIGAGAFIGSNSALVAPVTIGDGAIVGAGSVVTKDVSADALALVRPEQSEKPGWAARFRAAMTAKKKAG
jgi:bifunctional UDP-N-acetylglucosamine pyrophosphorylase / glucosamine-1-phosphate N-acetyltransferase